MRTYKEVLEDGIHLLDAAAIEEAGLDAWLLLEYAANINRAWYYAHMDEILDKKTESRYLEMCAKRAQHIPLQHITGRAYFMGYEFCVDERVLVPRQDTEVLVETALTHLKDSRSPKILDMCTGSGCIGISIQSFCSNTQVTAADISEDALKVAQKNAKENQVPVEFVHSDLFKEISGSYDMIVSNPPYIPSKVIETLMPEVRDHEPIKALDGKEDGLYFYRRITEESVAYLKPGGYLLYEIGHDQGEAVSSYMRENGFDEIEVIRDLAGLDRVVRGRR